MFSVFGCQLGEIQLCEIGDGMYARAGQLALDACMTDQRAAQILAGLPEDDEHLLRIKFLRERNGDWVVSMKTSLTQSGQSGRKARGSSRCRGTQKQGVLTGIDSVFYQNAYPVTAVAYGLYPIRDPDPANLAPVRDGDLICVAERVVEHFEGALRGHGLTPTRRQKLKEWEERVHKSGATVNNVAELEKILKRAIILRDIAGENNYYSSKYGRGNYRPIELIVHNGHAWPKDLHFSQSREVHVYEGDVWQAIQDATQGKPLAVWLLGGQDRQLTVDQFVL